MSGALQRLVRQSTTATLQGLRPRLPSRFESGGLAGLVETRSEIRAAVRKRLGARAPASVRGISAKPRARLHTAEPQAPSDARPPPAPTEEARSEPRHVDSGEAAPRRDRPAATTSPTPESVEPEPLLPRTDAAPEPPLAPRSGPSGPSRVSLAGNALAETGHAQDPAPHPPAEPPAPLLPTDLVAPAALPDGSPVAERAEPKRPGAVAAEPEITIHIGRLDIHADPPRRAPRAAPAERISTLPSLSDYLRGRRP